MGIKIYVSLKGLLILILLFLSTLPPGPIWAEDEPSPPVEPAQRPIMDRPRTTGQRAEMLRQKPEAPSGEMQTGDTAGAATSKGSENIRHVARPGEKAARKARGADGPGIMGGSFTMNFQDVGIRTLIRFISEITGKNFLVDPDVRGNVTILSPGKVTADEAYEVFLSVLDVHGYTAVPSGQVIKIISAAEARAKGIETLMKMKTAGVEDRVVTQLIPLKHGLATDFAKFIRPLVAKTGILIPYPETNTLIITDVESNIERLVKIIKELDVPGQKEKISIVALQHANAEKLAAQLSQLFQPGKGRRAGAVEEVVKIIADQRTNSLVIMASADATEDIEGMLKKLDREIMQRRGNLHVYALQNAVAEDVAKVLGELPGKGEEQKEGKAPPAPPPISKDVHITPDKATNTLVIVAEPDEFKILEEIIKKLDIPRILVYVEALILEVSADKALDLGVEWRVGDEYKGGLQEGSSGGVWSVSSEGLQSGLNKLAQGSFPAGFAVGVVGHAITLGGVTFPSIAAFARAVRTDSDFNVISTPQILTLDNEEAAIEVGQNIPYVTSVVESAAVTDRPIQNFEYRDIGVTLKVTPHVHKHDTVRLEVEQSIKNVLQTTAGADLLAPTTTYRTTKSTITVGNGETAVIGGLIETQMSRGKTMTPCLGGLPGVGWAFKQVSDTDDRRNLMVFLTPHTVESPEERRALYEEKRQYIDKEMEKSILKNQPEELRRKAFE